MKSVRRWVLAAPSIVGFLACAPPASANIIYSSQEPPKWAWSNQAGKGDARSWDGGLTSGNFFGAYSGSNFSMQPSLGDDDRKAQAKRIGFRAPADTRTSTPLTRQQLDSFRGTVADLGPTGDRPNAASPGIFINYVPDTAGLSDKGGGNTVPLPPAFVLAAVGLALVGAARKLGWGIGEPESE